MYAQKGFVAVPGSRRVWWPFPTSVYLYGVPYTVFFSRHYYYCFFFFLLPYSPCSLHFTLGSATMLIAWNFLLVLYRTHIYIHNMCSIICVLLCVYTREETELVTLSCSPARAHESHALQETNNFTQTLCRSGKYLYM